MSAYNDFIGKEIVRFLLFFLKQITCDVFDENLKPVSEDHFINIFIFSWSIFCMMFVCLLCLKCLSRLK